MKFAIPIIVHAVSERSAVDFIADRLKTPRRHSDWPTLEGMGDPSEAGNNAAERKLLIFALGDEQFDKLVREGERLRKERNVVYPPGIWTEEQYARFAITRAVTDTYTMREDDETSGK